MATRAEAKAAIAAASTATQNDIDVSLPAGVDIADGIINFNPRRVLYVLRTANLAAAEVLFGTITTSLNSQGRAYTVQRLRRGDDGDRTVLITSGVFTYRIIF